jgi:hypothetical protein
MRASQIDVAHGVDRFVAQVTEGLGCFRTKEIVVPVLFGGMDEDRIVREVIVVGDEVREIRGCVAPVREWNQQAVFWFLFQCVNVMGIITEMMRQQSYRMEDWARLHTIPHKSREATQHPHPRSYPSR